MSRRQRSSDGLIMFDGEITKPRWRVRRKGETNSYGPYTEAQLREYLQEGRIRLHDNRREGNPTAARRVPR
jgi:hypothetical protein